MNTEQTVVGTVTADGEGRRIYLRITVLIGVLAVLALAFSFVRPRRRVALSAPMPVAATAAAPPLVSLPPDARLLSATGTGVDGTAEFVLPEPAGPGSRLAEVCKLNPPLAAPAPSASSASYSDGRTSITLRYDAKTGRYLYEHRTTR